MTSLKSSMTGMSFSLNAIFLVEENGHELTVGGDSSEWYIDNGTPSSSLINDVFPVHGGPCNSSPNLCGYAATAYLPALLVKC
jgi:hypothetical protein